MNRLRFTLAQLMAVVLYVGFSFAALRNANEIWASMAFTLAFLMVSVALVGALARRGRARMAWAGFAVFGWSRLVVDVFPPMTNSVVGRIPPPGLLSKKGFTNVLLYFLDQSQSHYTFHHTQVILSLDIILVGLVGAIVGCLMAEKDKRPNS